MRLLGKRAVREMQKEKSLRDSNFRFYDRKCLTYQRLTTSPPRAPGPKYLQPNDLGLLFLKFNDKKHPRFSARVITNMKRNNKQ